MKRVLVVVLTLLLASSAFGAPQEEGFEKLELRVTATGQQRRVSVDRGAIDGLAVGDRVVFRPRQGGILDGVVVTVEDRSAMVELRGRDVVPPPGTRGEVFIPLARLAEQEEPQDEGDPEVVPVPPVVPPQQDTEPQEGAPEHPPWEEKDEDWKSGMSLLARTKAVRPEERPKRFSGRIFSMGAVVYTTEDDFKNSIFRTGVDVEYENPWDRGGVLNLATEINYTTESHSDNEGWDLLVDRASYAWGGTRFSNTRWEVGRFLQHATPELGLVDGVEWTKRRENGDLYGFSAGAMPELDEDLDTGSDLQVAGYYYWLAGSHDEFMFGGALQQTWHDGSTDRNLLVTKMHYLPLDAWDFRGTAWIDFYTDGDKYKDGVKVTEGWASISRSWESNGLDLSYRYLQFPDTDRNEFSPGNIALVDDEYSHRLSLDAYQWISERTRINGFVSGWTDQDDDGWTAESSVDMNEIFNEHDRSNAAFFAYNGRYSDTIGGRLSYGQVFENSSWTLLYEIADQRQDDFSADFDDLVQHRVRASGEVFSASGWTFSFWGEGGIYDGDDGHWAVGTFLQKSF